MSRLPVLSARKVCRVLEKLGFEPIRQKDSHIFYHHPDGRSTIIPMHHGEDLGRGLLHSIIREIEISRDEFLKLL